MLPTRLQVVYERGIGKGCPVTRQAGTRTRTRRQLGVVSPTPPGGITAGKRPESRDGSGWIRNMSSPPGFESRTVQPVASGCTN